MRWKNVLGISLLLLVGFMLGATFGPSLVTPQADSESNQRSRSSLTSRIEAELIRDLKLDKDQQTVLETAIKEARGKLRHLRKEYYPRVADILDEARDSIVPLLSEEQLQLREEMIRREKDEQKKREERRSGQNGNRQE